MGLVVEAVDVWAAPSPDRPGGLAEGLRALRDAGADLQCIIARREPDQPGKGVVFVTPLQGDQEIAAAAQFGFTAVVIGAQFIAYLALDSRGDADRVTRILTQT